MPPDNRDHETVVPLDQARTAFTLHRVQAALEGRLDPADLSADERVYYDDQVGETMDGTRTAAARDFWARVTGTPNTDR